MAILDIWQEIIRGEDHAFISLINNDLRFFEIVVEYMPRTDEVITLFVSVWLRKSIEEKRSILYYRNNTVCDYFSDYYL